MYTSVKLFMACIWFLVAGGFFYFDWLHQDRPGLTVWDTGVSIGWVAVFLGLYNLVWWWVSQSREKRRLALREAEARWKSELRNRSRPPQELNPDFDFTDEPPSEPPKTA
jgi:hypothetical protein